jgi:hypothetical protein
MEKQTYFSHEALARLVAAQGKIIDKVICHLWQNNIEKESGVELIDNLELHFLGGEKLTISCNQNGDGLDAIDYDYKKAVLELAEEFNGKIKLFAVNASSTKMWQDVIGKKLESVRITKDGDNHLAESVLLVIEDERRIVSISPMDGLVIDYYEED